MNGERLLEFAYSLQDWFMSQIIVIENLISLIVLILLFAGSYFFRKKFTQMGHDLLNNISRYLPGGWPAFWEEISFKLFLAVFIWGYNLFAAVLELPAVFTNITGYLLAAWLIIRLITWLLPTTFRVRLVSYLIWVVAVLNILGLYEMTISILEDIDVNFGEFSLSIMNVIRGVIMIIILFWIASWVEKYLRRRLEKAENITPSITVLLQKAGRVVLFTAALLMALSSIGIDLSAFAFLGGAIGVGLGFGLQKIVSNFISGIIIILDKSIKPGDVVEIGDVFGTVRTLNTRFVSVVTLAGKEYLIPNENFITDQVINWSYSDDFVRLDIEVGVGYDSDLKLVQELILQAVSDNSRIIEQPKPVCILKEFGDNTVNFEIRFWIQDPHKGVANIKSEVLLEVWDLLKENKINIAFPQRDLHLESISEDAVTKMKDILNSTNNTNKSEQERGE
ncbi:MAG: mechanosensitive ion channel family protein [Bacillota bacterium]